MSKDTDAPKPDPERDRPARPARPETPEQLPAPPVAEYPKMLYHEDGQQLIVNSKDEETAAAANGFKDTPQGTEPSREPRRRS